MASQMFPQLRPHPRAWPRENEQPRFDKPELVFNNHSDGFVVQATNWWLAHAKITDRNFLSGDSPSYIDACQTDVLTTSYGFSGYPALIDDPNQGLEALTLGGMKDYLNTYHAGGVFNISYEAGPFVPGQPYEVTLSEITVDDNPRRVSRIVNAFTGTGQRQFPFANANSNGQNVLFNLPITGPAPLIFVIEVRRTTSPETGIITEFRTAPPPLQTIPSAGTGYQWRSFANASDVEWRDGFDSEPVAIQVASGKAVNGQQVLVGTLDQSQVKIRPNRRSGGTIYIEVLDNEINSDAAVFLRRNGVLVRLTRYSTGVSSYYLSGRSQVTSSRFYSHKFSAAAGAGSENIYDGVDEVFVVSEAPSGPLEFPGHSEPVYEYSSRRREENCFPIQPHQVTGGGTNLPCIRQTKKRATVAIIVEHD
jgi:hypothetical protein